MIAPDHVKKYFETMIYDVKAEFEIAKLARAKGYDPANKPEIHIAANMAERVVGLVSIVSPQIIDSDIAKRIQELEVEYGILDWRVALVIAHEVSEQRFCKFTDEREAMETGIRIGFAYVTNGVVSSPLEGFVSLDLVSRRDKQGKFFRVNYAGPVRNAGGTAAAVSVIIADYVRHKMGYALYDPTDDEVHRCQVELTNYHDRVANLQYFPAEIETDFLVRNCPVEISGDPTEKMEVSNYKNLPRIPSNRLRAGYCLIYSACLALKAPKLWKKLSNWGKEMGLGHWKFLEEYLKIQHQVKATSETLKQNPSGEEKISPVYTYIKDLVAGRPVFGHPLKPGGFRLRFGRSRVSGLSGQSLHPATMIIANEFIATGSQLKVERPGKAAAYTVCDELEGPIVRLKSGEVLQITSSTQAHKLKADVEKILFLGDVLICYGDFLDRAHPLLPAGYCEEWWVQELKEAKAIVNDDLWNNPITYYVPFDDAVAFSKEYSVPLHPNHTFFYFLASVKQLTTLWEAIRKAPHRENLILQNTPELKEILEMLCVPHLVVQKQHLVMQDDVAKALRYCFSREKPKQEVNSEQFMQSVSPVFLRDKAGVFIGARLGRPEKAKMRKLTGSPHSLFPVGSEGGRLRSMNEVFSTGYVNAQFEVFFCPQCEKEVVLKRCPTCDSISSERYFARDGTLTRPEAPNASRSKHTRVAINDYLQFCLSKMKTKVYPDLIKGVRGTMNEDHASEHLMKGILRARNDVHVNKDGTIRYDASEVPITHFKPKEIGITAAKAITLGYESDIDGNPLVSDDQVIELFPQDVILPACDESPDEPCDAVLVRTAKFIDELLKTLYSAEPFYNVSKTSDLIGHYVIALAPHTSAGTIGRIIGFSKTQGLFFHPYLHCAVRRDCDGDESSVSLLLDCFLNFSRRYLPSSRGGTMDAPLVLAMTLDPAEVDDMVLNMDIMNRYPLTFYQACLEYKMPWETDMTVVNDTLGTPEQFHKMGFTHKTTDLNDGNRCSAYKTLPSMQEKLESQMDLAEKLVSVDERDVARLVIEKHFIRDLKGNLRKFSQQVFRCVKCNTKFRRPPLKGNCGCGGRIIFTISEGSVVKYLSPSESLVKAYKLDTYLAQTIELTRRRIEEVFGKDPEKQIGLGEWFA